MSRDRNIKTRSCCTLNQQQLVLLVTLQIRTAFSVTYQYSCVYPLNTIILAKNACEPFDMSNKIHFIYSGLRDFLQPLAQNAALFFWPTCPVRSSDLRPFSSSHDYNSAYSAPFSCLLALQPTNTFRDFSTVSSER